jgi:hypothetical protein
MEELGDGTRTDSHSFPPVWDHQKREFGQAKKARVAPIFEPFTLAHTLSHTYSSLLAGLVIVTNHADIVQSVGFSIAKQLFRAIRTTL